MKSRTSFCNATVLKKDITRFLPLWVIYLVCGLLAMSSLSSHTAAYSASAMGSFFLRFASPTATFLFGIVLALLLFGDLFNSRLCNALHAMPLRRETWFATHFIAGMLMLFVPSLVIALTAMPRLDGYWHLALLWLGGTMLMHLFFFGLATLCVMGTGNKFAALVVYLLVNFIGVELMYLVSALVMPFLDGVRFSIDPWCHFSPVVQLMRNTYLDMDNLVTIDDIAYGNGWPYLFLLGGLGLVLAALALVLYRRRDLERAGDFAAIVPVKWLVAIFGSLACGMVFRIFGYENQGSAYALLFVGLTVGFFLLEMLLQRRVKVFNKSTLVKWVALVLTFVLVLAGSALDVLGIASYVPRPERVESVMIADSYLDADDLKSGSGCVTVTDASAIETVCQVHRLAIQENVDSTTLNETTYLTFHYALKSGRTVTRSYRVRVNAGTAYKLLKPLLAGVEYTFGTNDLQDIKDGLAALSWGNVDFVDIYDTQMVDDLLELIWSDVQKGLLEKTSKSTSGDRICLYYYLGGGYYRYLTLIPTGESCASLDYLNENSGKLYAPQNIFLGDDLDTVLENLHYVDCYCEIDEITLNFYEEQAQQIVKYLWEDAANGLLVQDDEAHTELPCFQLTIGWDSKKNGWNELALNVWSDSATYAYLNLLQDSPPASETTP